MPGSEFIFMIFCLVARGFRERASNEAEALGGAGFLVLEGVEREVVAATVTVTRSLHFG